MGLFNQRSPGEINQLRNTAQSVVDLENTEGWQAFVSLAEALIQSHTPQVSDFTHEEATKYASQLVFISGIKRCLGLIDQQKDVLKSLKDKK